MEDKLLESEMEMERLIFWKQQANSKIRREVEYI
jgi:hypothetical protein